MREIINALALPVSSLGSWPRYSVFVGLGLALILAILMADLVRRVSRLPRRAPYQRKELLTGNETEFFRRLKRALPDCEVMTQVAMGALMQPVITESDPRFWELRKRFAEKICDYVITRAGSPRGSSIVVIELDDRTHDPLKDAARDALLSAVGIRTVRYQSRHKPDEQQIRKQVLPLLGLKPVQITGN